MFQAECVSTQITPCLRVKTQSLLLSEMFASPALSDLYTLPLWCKADLRALLKQQN